MGLVPFLVGVLIIYIGIWLLKLPLHLIAKRQEKESKTRSRWVAVLQLIISIVLSALLNIFQITSSIGGLIEPTILVNDGNDGASAVVTIEDGSRLPFTGIYYTVIPVSPEGNFDVPEQEAYERYNQPFRVTERCIIAAYCKVAGVYTNSIKVTYSPHVTGTPPDEPDNPQSPDDEDGGTAAGGSGSEQGSCKGTASGGDGSEDSGSGDAGIGNGYADGGDSGSPGATSTPPPIEEMVLDAPFYMEVGQGQYAGVCVYPDDTDPWSVSWWSSDPDVVTVDTEGYIYAVNPGIATLRVTSIANTDISCAQVIHVEPQSPPDDETDCDVDWVILLAVGDKYRPRDDNDDLITNWSAWSTENPKIVDFYRDEYIIGESEGTATISITVEGVEYRWQVIVSSCWDAFPN